MTTIPTPEAVAQSVRDLAASKPRHFELGFRIGAAAIAEADSDQARNPLAVVMTYVETVKVVDPEVMNLHTTDGFIVGAVSAALTTRQS